MLLLNVSAMIVVQAQPPDTDRTQIIQEITPSIIPSDPVPKAVEPERLNRQDLPEKMRRSVKPLLEPFRQRWFPPIDKRRWRPPTELAIDVMAVGRNKALRRSGNTLIGDSCRNCEDLFRPTFDRTVFWKHLGLRFSRNEVRS